MLVAAPNRAYNPASRSSDEELATTDDHVTEPAGSSRLADFAAKRRWLTTTLPRAARARWRRPGWRGADLLAAGGVLALATAAMLPARNHLDAFDVGLIFLILVIAIALFANRWASIASAIAAFLLFDLLFISPYYTFSVARTDDVLALIAFLAVASVTSQLVYQARARTVEALRRGHQMELLNELSWALIADVSSEPLLSAIVHRVVAVIGADACAILMPDEAGWLATRACHGPPPDDADRDDAMLTRWAFEHGEPVGSGPMRRRVIPPPPPSGSPRRPMPRLANRPQPTLYIPIATARRMLGVLRVARPTGGAAFTADDRQLLTTFANQAALALERARLIEEATQAAVLARSDELKSALLSAVSHELRTPLASIKASATSLLQPGVTWSADDARDLLQAIDEETDRLTRIVGNLLDLSRIEAGALRPDRQWNDLEEAILDAVDRAQASLGDHPLRVSIQPGLPAVRFDDVEIAQVLMNLLDNAARYSPPGAPIDVEATRTAREVEIAVADGGRGLPAGDEERVFEKFYRGAGQPGVSGAGIGLSICRGIVDAHGGRIWAERRPDAGASFHFTLPLDAADTATGLAAG